MNDQSLCLDGTYETAKIMDIEEEVRAIHFDPPIKKLAGIRIPAKKAVPLFWKYHVKPVIEISKALAEKYDADRSACWLAAIFHDIARIYGREPHDVAGAEIAFDFLAQRGISPYDAQIVQAVIQTHSCKARRSVYLEQKILATADAVAYFKQPFYLWFGTCTAREFDACLAVNSEKIEHDFWNKIFFQDELEEVRQIYEVMRQWCKTG